MGLWPTCGVKNTRICSWPTKHLRTKQKHQVVKTRRNTQLPQSQQVQKSTTSCKHMLCDFRCVSHQKKNSRAQQPSEGSGNARIMTCQGSKVMSTRFGRSPHVRLPLVKRTPWKIDCIETGVCVVCRTSSGSHAHADSCKMRVQS